MLHESYYVYNITHYMRQREGFYMSRRVGGTETRACAEIGEHIASWRRIMRLTQDELASRARISRESLSQLENGTGTMSLDRILSVANVLGITEEVVKGFDPIETQYGRLQLLSNVPQRVRKNG